MIEITRKLETFFKHKEANPEEDDGNNRSGGQYWEFTDPNDVEC
jgi:hypothetical protein